MSDKGLQTLCLITESDRNFSYCLMLNNESNLRTVAFGKRSASFQQLKTTRTDFNCLCDMSFDCLLHSVLNKEHCKLIISSGMPAK